MPAPLLTCNYKNTIQKPPEGRSAAVRTHNCHGASRLATTNQFISGPVVLAKLSHTGLHFASNLFQKPVDRVDGPLANSNALGEREREEGKERKKESREKGDKERETKERRAEGSKKESKSRVLASKIVK